MNSKLIARITGAGQKRGRSSLLDNAIDWPGRFLIISAARNRGWFREISKARPRRPQNPPPARRHHRKVVILAFVLSSFFFFSLSPEFRDICVLQNRIQWLSSTIVSETCTRGCVSRLITRDRRRFVLIARWIDYRYAISPLSIDWIAASDAHSWARNFFKSTPLSRAMNALSMVARIFEVVSISSLISIARKYSLDAAISVSLCLNIRGPICLINKWLYRGTVILERSLSRSSRYSSHCEHVPLVHSWSLTCRFALGLFWHCTFALAGPSDLHEAQLSVEESAPHEGEVRYDRREARDWTTVRLAAPHFVLPRGPSASENEKEKRSNWRERKHCAWGRKRDASQKRE